MLIEKIEKMVRTEKLIEYGDTIVVGVSGGPDSMCLLHVLEELRKKDMAFDIVVAHINHMIRVNSILDEEYVEDYCKRKGIPVFIKRIQVEEIAKQKKIGTEETGRIVRYQFFKEIKEQVGANKIATAHNANDNAETVLLNVIRGCGLTGLKGIELKSNELIRPLIEITRNEIEKYCEENQLKPRIDESNEQLIYQRNKIRNVVIPYIQKEFNPNFITTLNKLSQIAKEESKYIEENTKKIYESILIQEGKKQISIDIKKFNLQERVIKKRIVRYTIHKVAGNVQGLQNIHIEDIITLCEKEIGNKYLAPNKNIRVCIKNKKIFFEAL